jgi:flagellar basal body-associated protein FliL
MADKDDAQPTAPKPKSAVMAFLPLILIILLVPAAAWLTLRFMSPGTAKTAPKPASSQASGHSAPAAKPVAEDELPKSHPGLVAPLTRATIGFHRKKYFGKLAIMDVNGDALGEAKPEKIVVNVAATRGGHVIVARLGIQGDDPPLVSALNLNYNRLLDSASGVLSAKNLADVSKPDIQALLRTELAATFSDILGPGILQDVHFLEFDVRPR